MPEGLWQLPQPPLRHDGGRQRVDDGHASVERIIITTTRTGGSEAAGRPYNEPGAQGYRNAGQATPAHTVKLGPIGARRVTAGRLLVQQKLKNAFFSDASDVLNEPKKWLDIKSCGPDASGAGAKFAKASFRGLRWQESRSPGRARSKP
jgi:hypothetical protein